jgi:hypothetical protein
MNTSANGQQSVPVAQTPEDAKTRATKWEFSNTAWRSGLAGRRESGFKCSAPANERPKQTLVGAGFSGNFKGSGGEINAKFKI